MNDKKQIKETVKSKYAEIAVESNRKSCCCGSDNSKIIDYTIMKDDYSSLEGYIADADMGLGCGVPTEFAAIKRGDTVVDLGSGAGNDIFVALPYAGEEGKLIGIDFTQEMIDKANRNKEKSGKQNIEFKLGEIENIPLSDNTADVVISNCVLNLVPDKKAAFGEIYRIIKPGGHFCVSDIVIKGNLPDKLKQSAEMYAGCVAGAIQQDEYLGIISDTGFGNIEIKRTKVIELPHQILKQYLSPDEIEEFLESNIGIFSITVVGFKESEGE